LALLRLALALVYWCALRRVRALWRVFGALCAVLCASAALLSLSLCRESLNFGACWLFGCSGVFLCGCVVFVRLWSILEPLAVALAFAPSVLRSVVALLPSVMGELWTVCPSPIMS
jgi:hypothetical protein